MKKPKGKITKAEKKINVVVIGGGTGTFTVLTGLKFFPELSLKTIVGVTDSGGSTGKLRDEFGILPVGDFRQAIVALAADGNGKNLLRDLFLYRFEKGDGLKGHNFGNLLLTALTDILGSEDQAIVAASRILRIKGEVMMVSNDNVDLVAEYDDGTVQVGEARIDEPDSRYGNDTRIKNLKVQPETQVSEKAKHAILEADYIVMGPGDLYTSLLCNIVIPGVKEAAAKSKAKFIYTANLMTKHGQTDQFKISDHIEEVQKYLGKYPDFVLVNNSPLPAKILKNYLEEQAYPVIDDVKSKYKDSEIVKAELISSDLIERKENDVVKRSLIRHDSYKLADALRKIMI